MMRFIKHSLVSVVLLLAFGSLIARADDQAQSRPHTNQELAQAISSLFSITLQDYFIASRWNRPGTANVVELRTLIPFEVWGQKNLMRLNIPFRTESELGPGLSDVRFFDLLMFETGAGMWGVGPIFNLGVNKGPGIDTLQAGPALTGVLTSIKGWSIGFLNQNLFSNQVAVTTLQPILVYRINPTWTLSLGELPIVYNWKKSQISVFSLGLQVGLMVKVGQQPVRFFVNPQLNTKSSTQLYRWTIAAGVTIPLLPLSRR